MDWSVKRQFATLGKPGARRRDQDPLGRMDCVLRKGSGIFISKNYRTNVACVRKAADSDIDEKEKL